MGRGVAERHLLWEVPQRCRGAGLSSWERPVHDLSLASVQVRPGPLGTGAVTYWMALTATWQHPGSLDSYLD